MSGRKISDTPRFARWLTSRFIRDGLHEEFFGDLDELFEDRRQQRGLRHARWMYWVDTLYLLFGFTKIRLFKNQNNITMFKSHFLIALRSFGRNKVYAGINILGLAVGMGICLTIFQYIHSELSYDRFHSQVDEIHRVIVDRSQGGESLGPDVTMPHALATSALNEIPEVKDFVRLYVPGEGSFVINPEDNKPFTLEPEDMLFTDPSFFTVFDFELVKGDAQSIFSDKYNVVITEEMAEKYFGFDNPMGKTLKVGGGPSSGTYTVVGVLADFPKNSHLQFDFIFSMENFFQYGWMGAITRYEHAPWFSTYLVLEEQADPQQVSQKLDAIFAKNSLTWNYDEIMQETTRLQPLTDIHLKSEPYTNGEPAKANGSWQDIRIFGLIALFILVIAWVNYINLATARSLSRAKEVGVRKSLGALRGQLVSQFLVESFLTNVLAAILAVGLAFAILPTLSGMVGYTLELSLLAEASFWAYAVLVISLGALLAGLYPAFVLSGFNPVSVLKGKTPKARSGKVRKGLIVFQFVISVFLIAATYLVYQQISFMKKQELGMDIEQIVALEGPMHVEVLDGGPQLTSNEGLAAFHVYSRKVFKTFREEIKRKPGVMEVTGSRAVPGQTFNTWRNNIRRIDEPEDVGRAARLFYAGEHFGDTYDIELLAGQSFEAGMTSEDIMINEEAVEAFGLGTPEEAVGQILFTGSKKRIVVGVTSNFHWQSLKDAQTPMILFFSGSTPRYISIKMKVSNVAETMAEIKTLYDELYPGNPFEYFFVDDAFNRQYAADQRFGDLFLSLTFLAIFIASIGLFALVAYSTTMRVREIGIRKVLGAQAAGLMLLLSREYLGLLFWAILLAFPAIWFWSGEWLQNYAYRVGIGVDLFVIPAILILILALLTVSHRTYRTAKANPVDALRTE